MKTRKCVNLRFLVLHWQCFGHQYFIVQEFVFRKLAVSAVFGKQAKAKKIKYNQLTKSMIYQTFTDPQTHPSFTKVTTIYMYIYMNLYILFVHITLLHKHQFYRYPLLIAHIYSLFFFSLFCFFQTYLDMEEGFEKECFSNALNLCWWNFIRFHPVLFLLYLPSSFSSPPHLPRLELISLHAALVVILQIVFSALKKLEQLFKLQQK